MHLVLRHGLEDTDEEVGICFGRHVVEELWRIGEQYDWILTELGEITSGRAQEALEDYAGLLIERSAHQELLPRIWQLRNAITAYDGAYVALAEALNAPLLTCDTKLARSHGHHAKIEVAEASAQ